MYAILNVFNRMKLYKGHRENVLEIITIINATWKKTLDNQTRLEFYTFIQIYIFA